MSNNFVPKVNCPACRRDVKTNNAGQMDAHANQRTGKMCPAGGYTVAEAEILFTTKGERVRF